MTKIDKIEEVLKSGKKVTPLTAIQICGAMRLAALIFDLKKRGHDIRTTIRQDTQGDDYAEYKMFFPLMCTAAATPEVPGDTITGRVTCDCSCSDYASLSRRIPVSCLQALAD